MTNRDLQRWYRRYNKEYFGGKLPPARVRFAKIAWMGEAYLGSGEIYINVLLKKWERGGARFTLLHEMAHLSLPASVDHGPRFQKEMLRLAKAGAFNGVW